MVWRNLGSRGRGRAAMARAACALLLPAWSGVTVPSSHADPGSGTAEPTKATPFPFEPPEPPKPAGRPVVREVSPGVYKVAEDITLEAKARRIRFPAKVNMREGLVEFFCVTEMGKIHEAVLSTRVVPSHLHVAVLLMAGKGEIPEPTSAEESAPLPKGCDVDVSVSWKDQEGMPVSSPAARLITHLERKKSPPDETWAYTSSRILQGRFLGDQSGDVVAIMESVDALINIRDADRANDEVWGPNTERLPEVGTPVEVTITLPPRPSEETGDPEARPDPSSPDPSRNDKDGAGGPSSDPSAGR